MTPTGERQANVSEWETEREAETGTEGKSTSDLGECDTVGCEKDDERKNDVKRETEGNSVCNNAADAKLRTELERSKFRDRKADGDLVQRTKQGPPQQGPG